MKDIRKTSQFCYTQQSLTAFENCPLKFKKRYMEGLNWDSLPDEASKASLDRGNSFHLLAQRYFSGIPHGLNENARDYEILIKWMRNLESYFPIRPDSVYLPEHTLRSELGGLNLEANFDLIVIEDGQLRIWDWKTHGSRSGSGFKQDETGLINMKKKLENSLQTMVYLYVLQEQVIGDEGTGYLSQIKGKSALCMKYWQPEPPHVIAEIDYDTKTHESFRSHLLQLLNKICGYDYSAFDKSLYSKHCKLCEFNWFCNGLKTEL